jgi:phage terminase small subunit
MPAKKNVKLTDEQIKLANECTKLQRETVINIECYGLSQVKAYKKAGGKANGKAAESTVSKMLSFPKVKKFRESFAVEVLRESIMSRDEALERLSKHARIKITDICTFKLVEVETSDGDIEFNTVWEMKNAEDIDPDVAACIKSVSFTKNGPKIELYDATGSIKLLGDMQGWNAAKELSLKGSLDINYTDLSDEELEAKIAELRKEVSKVND